VRHLSALFSSGDLKIMLKNIWLLALMIPTLLIGCDNTPADDDDDDTERTPILVEVSPTFEQTDFFYRSTVVAEFDIAPDSATVTLLDASGSPVAGTAATAANGREFTFDPDADLDSSAGYSMVVEWSPAAEGHSPFTNAFQTSAHGGAVPDPTAMVGLVYSIDLAGATFVEPPGIGPILQSQMDGFSVLFTPMAESDFEGGELHVMGAVGGASESGKEIQDPCAPTLDFTAGPDGVIGTDADDEPGPDDILGTKDDEPGPDGILGTDDTPAAWNNPEMVLSADALPLTIQGVTATIQDLLISGTFHPDFSNMRGGVFAGVIDTRPLVGALGSGEDENEICDLVESTVGVPCISCTDDGDDTDEVFCLALRAEDLAADVIKGLILEDRPCELIITDFVTGGTCESEAGAYDADSDGMYELCPTYNDQVAG